MPINSSDPRLFRSIRFIIFVRVLAIILIVAGAIAATGPGLDSSRQPSVWWLIGGIIVAVIGTTVLAALRLVKRQNP